MSNPIPIFASCGHPVNFLPDPDSRKPVTDQLNIASTNPCKKCNRLLPADHPGFIAIAGCGHTVRYKCRNKSRLFKNLLKIHRKLCPECWAAKYPGRLGWLKKKGLLREEPPQPEPEAGAA
jgi:hypothetical protein